MFAVDLVLGFEKFFPKSEESAGVNKSAEGRDIFKQCFFQFSLHLQCVTDVVDIAF